MLTRRSIERYTRAEQFNNSSVKSMSQKKLVIFGSGEMAAMAKFYFTHESQYEVIAFTVDDEYINRRTNYEGLKLFPWSKTQKKFPPDKYLLHVAVGYTQLNKLREKLYLKVKNAGYTLASFISPKAITFPDLKIGDNCLILEKNNLQPNVTIGNNVIIWSANHIGHRTVIRDHVYMASNICISGYCEIKERTWIGVGVNFVDHCNVGPDCFITMGAQVTVKEVPQGSVVLGARSTTLGPDEKLAKKIKFNYFKNLHKHQ